MLTDLTLQGLVNPSKSLVGVPSLLPTYALVLVILYTVSLPDFCFTFLPKYHMLRAPTLGCESYEFVACICADRVLPTWTATVVHGFAMACNGLRPYENRAMLSIAFSNSCCGFGLGNVCKIADWLVAGVGGVVKLMFVLV